MSDRSKANSGALVLLGVNHKTAPIELRERLAIPSSRLSEATRSLVEGRGVREAMILSTCNRVEILATIDAEPDLEGFLHEFFSVDRSLLTPHLYEYRESEAVRHLFRVTSSLDSMVVGEPQILGQVKEAYTVAKSAGTVQKSLEKLLQNAFNVAKRVRNETEIGSSAVSVASIAVDLAEKIFGSLTDKKVLLVGAGEMSELAARHLVRRGASRIFVANRSGDRAASFAAQFGGSVIRFDDLHTSADLADIVITSTGSPAPIFRHEHGAHFLHKRRNRPMLFIDIAVPRDVDPEMNRVEGVFLYDIDDLQSVAESNRGGRARQAEQAEAIVAQEVERYQQMLSTLDAVPTIRELQQSMEAMRQAELRKLDGKRTVFTDDQWEAVEGLTRAMMNKFLHPAIQAIKASAAAGDLARLEILRTTFDRRRAEVYLSAHRIPESQTEAPEPQADGDPAPGPGMENED